MLCETALKGCRLILSCFKAGAVVPLHFILHSFYSLCFQRARKRRHSQFRRLSEGNAASDGPSSRSVSNCTK